MSAEDSSETTMCPGTVKVLEIIELVLNTLLSIDKVVIELLTGKPDTTGSDTTRHETKAEAEAVPTVDTASGDSVSIDTNDDQKTHGETKSGDIKH